VLSYSDHRAGVITPFKKSQDMMTQPMVRNPNHLIRHTNGEVEVDPSGKKWQNDRWIAQHQNSDGSWKYDAFVGKVSPCASKLIVQYIVDAHMGKNLPKGSPKRPRSYYTIWSYRERLPRLVGKMEKLYDKEITNLHPDEALQFFKHMRDGVITRNDGEPFKDVRTTAKIFCAFWRWHMRVSKTQGKDVEDIVSDIDLTKGDKPEWNYFTLEDVKRMVDIAPNAYYRALLMLMFDAGVRPPKELMNIRVCDLTPVPNTDYLYLQVREKTSKTYGRKIKLLLSSSYIKKYIAESGKKDTDFVFHLAYSTTKNAVKMLGYKVLGLGTRKQTKSKHFVVSGGIRLYDFRHCSVCHFLPIYKSENQMMYRYGWRSAEMIHYYSEFIGMKDTLSENDLLTDDSKTRLEIELEKEKQKVTMIQEQMKVQQEDMSRKMQQLEAMMLQKFAKEY